MGIMLLAWAGAAAAPVDEATARSKAQQFVDSRAGNGMLRMMVPSSGEMQLVYTAMSDVVINRPVYYIYNTSNSFIVVSGNDLVRDILIYGDAPLDCSDIPCGLQFILDMYKSGIDHLNTGNDQLMSPPRNVSPEAETNVEPLLAALWDQGEPYNNYCPTYNGEACCTGCACTSLSMVFYHWKFANLTTRLSAYTTNSLGIALDALEPTDFDWDNMLDIYTEGDYTEEQGNAVALLMRYVGQAELMDYAPDGSGAYAFNINNAVLKFGYDSGSAHLNKKNYSTAQWRAMMLDELHAGRPIVYVGVDGASSAGHAFNVDGYDAENDLFHINFGWNGNGNAYCALDDFSAGDYTFNYSQSMIIGIQPPSNIQPTLTVTPATLSLSTQVNKPVNKSISVKSTGVNGDLTVELNDSKGCFSLEKTVIPAEESAVGTILNVYFNPTETGIATASVTISGPGVEPQTVSLTGIATMPAITVSPATLDLEAEVGETATATFTVLGANLTSGLVLSLQGAQGCFFINKSVLSIDNASTGATVTVTYRPNEAGETITRVIVSGGGAAPQTVTLNGTATAPEPPGEPMITTSVSTLHFGNCYNGYNERRSLMLTGENLTEDITLSLRGERSGDFSIVSPKTITPAMAAQGVEVIVNSFPYTVGLYTDVNLVISCPDVPEILISITGYGIKTGAFIDVDQESMRFSTPVGEPVTMTLGVKLREFDGWLASFGGGVSLNSTAIDFIVPRLKILPVNGVIDGDECFSIISSEVVDNGATAIDDSLRFTIEFYPLEEGTYSAQLILETFDPSHEAHPVVVELTGTTFSFLPGDMDGDGELTDNDIMLLGQALANSEEDMLSLPAADVNGDGTVSLADLILLVDLVRGII